MKVASLALCKELYERSGWIGPAFLYQPDGEPGLMGPTSSERPPAYDLGFLLRKFPDDMHVRIVRWDNVNKWRALVEKTAFEKESGNADTPEEAAAKLAIELFKQGILTKS